MKKGGCIILFLLFIACKKQSLMRQSGSAFGTTYSILYESDKDFYSDFDVIFDSINKSMSTYLPTSIISELNNTDFAKVDQHFKTVFLSSKTIFKDTHGAFDPTIGAVVNAWDFGPSGAIEQLDSLRINELMNSVGLDKVSLIGLEITKPKSTILDFNAIAKGYGVDVIGRFLESHQIVNYLIEIGGEIRCKGINPEKSKPWVIGIQNPNLESNSPFLKSVRLTNESMATSGTYRKFKIDRNGLRYTHIIDPKTGFPTRTNILSVSVITKDCMVADAYATALQTMSLFQIEEFLKTRPQLRVFVIFEAGNDTLEFKSFNGF